MGLSSADLSRKGGMFGTFLRAQATSPSLTLAHAEIGDSGALEIAQFLAASDKLTRLDLTGNGITSAGASHISHALMQNRTLVSLSLKHNGTGEGGDHGIRAICRTVASHATLRHLDLKHNRLTGPLHAHHIGELLKANNPLLTHLELSWNPIDPCGGQVLLDCLRMNTHLVDCQLEGCRLAEEQLAAVSELLLRNRKAKGADRQVGPWDPHFEEGRTARALELNLDGGIAGATARGLGVAAAGSGCHAVRAFQASANLQVTGAGQLRPPEVNQSRTDEIMRKLMQWQSKPGVSSAAAQRAMELYASVERAQTQTLEDRAAARSVEEHTRLLGESFHDRELRYKEDIAKAKDSLLDYAQERKGLDSIFRRYVDELTLVREESARAATLVKEDEKRHEADAASARHDLSRVEVERKECVKRLMALEDEGTAIQKDTDRMRGRSGQVRERVILAMP